MAAISAELRQAEVLFNYISQYKRKPLENGLFRPAPESKGLDRNPQCARHLLLEVAVIIEERMQVRWNYSENIHRRSTIEELTNIYMTYLRSLIG